MRALPFTLAIAVATAIACASKAPDKPNQRQALLCADGQAPCGTGCRPAGSVCCDDGTGKTSSYCDGTAGCFVPAARGCTTGGAPSAYCCGAAGTTGSVDCPPAQHHCGGACVPLDTPCCTGDACTSQTTAGGATCPATGILCGFCNKEQVCHACASGSCCSGDVCANLCVSGDACAVGATPTTCSSSADCGNGKVCVSSRRCTIGQLGGQCSCNGDTTGTCVDFSSRGITIGACGTCTVDDTACCPGTMCVDGQCKATCP